MSTQKRKIVGLGELLWDVLPTGRQLGGAPANFAYITSLLGDEGIPASRLGEDDLGTEAILRLTELGLSTDFIQKGAIHPTGTVKVEIDAGGQPRFEICESVAWDFLEWTAEWRELACQADAVCFGSLAQRSIQSHSTIHNFLESTRPDAVRVFDVNLRQNFFTREVLAKSMKLATIVKMNHEELPRIMKAFEFAYQDEESSAQRLAEVYGLKLVCITRGNDGSLLSTADHCTAHPGYRVKVADTIGAGDAFTATLVHEYLRGVSLEEMSEMANRVGAWVASQVGATPPLKPGGLKDVIAKIESK